MSTDEALISVAGATHECAKLGYLTSESSIKRATDRGELPAIRTSDRSVRLFRVDDVRAFAKRRLA